MVNWGGVGWVGTTRLYYTVFSLSLFRGKQVGWTVNIHGNHPLMLHFHLVYVTPLPHFHLYYVTSFTSYYFSLMFLLLPYQTLFRKFLFWNFIDVLGVLQCHLFFFIWCSEKNNSRHNSKYIYFSNLPDKQNLPTLFFQWNKRYIPT